MTAILLSIHVIGAIFYWGCRDEYSARAHYQKYLARSIAEQTAINQFYKTRKKLLEVIDILADCKSIKYLYIYLEEGVKWDNIDSLGIRQMGSAMLLSKRWAVIGH